MTCTASVMLCKATGAEPIVLRCAFWCALHSGNQANDTVDAINSPGKGNVQHCMPKAGSTPAARVQACVGRVVKENITSLPLKRNEHMLVLVRVLVCRAPNSATRPEVRQELLSRRSARKLPHRR